MSYADPEADEGSYAETIYSIDALTLARWRRSLPAHRGGDVDPPRPLGIQKRGSRSASELGDDGSVLSTVARQGSAA